MANMLSDLDINEVSLVDAPANSETINGVKTPRAKVALFKRDDTVDKASKTEDGTSYPKSDYAYAPDDVPSHWKLRLTLSPGGKPDPHIVGAAVAALGEGFRGNKVEIPAEALHGVKARVRAAWEAANPDKGPEEVPEALQIKKGVTTMTLEQIEKRLNDQDAVLKALTDERDVLKTENELVLKMSPTERKCYAKMSADERKAFMSADEEGKKKIMEKAAKEMEKAAKPAEGSKEEERAETGEEEEKEMEEAKKALLKKLDDVDALTARVTKAEAELATANRAARLQKFAKRAEAELPHTAGTPEEKGELIMKLADALGDGSDGFKKMMDSLTAADKAVASQFVEIGKSGGGGIPALKAFEAAVEEITKRDHISVGKATERVMMEQPRLYQDYDKDRRQAALKQ